MVDRSQRPAAFRAEPGSPPALAPTRVQTVAMLLGLVLVASTIAVVSYLVKPNRARTFSLFYGSIFLNDERAPVAVDLTDAKPTVRLVDANSQVHASSPANLAVVPLSGGTLLLNTATGEFNMVDASGFVIKTTGGGVPLPATAGTSGSRAVAAGPAAYIVQSGPARTSLYLVGQSTVQSAQSPGARVKPRAYANISQPPATGAGALVSASGSLWMLTGATDSHRVSQFSVPPGSDAGATLIRTNHGTVTGPAALGVASRGADGSGPDVVGLASARELRVFTSDGTDRAVPLPGLTGVDAILPASNQAGRLSYLYHSGAGWSVVSIGADGTGLAGPTRLAAIPPAAQLATPAASNGHLYTMDEGSSGALWAIGTGAGGTAQVIAGAQQYPISRTAAGRPQESSAFSDASVVARASRVIFNSPNHVLALAVFTDGTHRPVPIDKSAVVDLNSAGGAPVLPADRANKSPTAPKPQLKAPQQQVAPVNNALLCQTSHQVPHIPTITQASSGSRSATLLWSYPLLDPHDCAPSTYVVSITLLSADAPPAPASVTVQGQDGVTLTGLFPSTRYQLGLTAFINGTGTPAAPVQITTGPEGPAAPSNVRASTDNAGNWAITWTSCGGVAQGCVPTATWTIIPSFCDGLGLSSPPAARSIPGDPTQHSFSATYQGSDALLGRGLSFHVQGIGSHGTVGTLATSGCAYSWSPPIAAQLTLRATTNALQAAGSTTSGTLALDLGSDPVRAVGGLGAQFTYQITGGGSSLTIGPTSQLSVGFDNVTAGTQYSAQVSVSPPRHAEASIIVGPVPIIVSAPWPPMSLTATYAASPGQTVPMVASLDFSISGLPAVGSNGESLMLSSASTFTCGGGNTSFGLSNTYFNASSGSYHQDNIPLLVYNGPCTVSVVLIEDPASYGQRPPIFGGKPSPVFTANLAGTQPPTLDARSSDFTASWVPQPDAGNADVLVRYTGPATADQLTAMSTKWSIDVIAPDGHPCAVGTAPPTAGGVIIPVDTGCIDQHGQPPIGGQWTISISYQDTSGIGQTHTMTPPEPVAGEPPTYTAPAPPPSPTPTPTRPRD